MCWPPLPHPNPTPARSNVLPPRLSNLAFIGQHATFAHVLTASLESRWLTGVLSGQVKLPNREAQLEDIARQQASRAGCVWLALFGLGGGGCVQGPTHAHTSHWPLSGAPCCLEWRRRLPHTLLPFQPRTALPADHATQH